MTQAPETSAAKSDVRPTDFDAVVVGAGFSGMTMLYRLRELGFSVRAFETGDGVGGTWYWNRYPGARVDIPSMQYSLSISPEVEQEWEWPEMYSAQDELERYANHIADRFDLRRDIQFETTVTAARYDEGSNRWVVETDRGDRVTAKYFITAAGCLSATNVPNFEGIHSFEGDWYHTSRWPSEGVDLAGKRVAVIGTGSTGVQVVPVVANQAEHLYVLQRTPHYSLPINNKPMDPEFVAEWKKNYPQHRQEDRLANAGASLPVSYPDRSATAVSEEERNEVFESAWGNGPALLFCFNDVYTNAESNEYAAEFVRGKIRQIVKDPDVAELLAPKDYPIGTKRICFDDGYYETFNRENVTLVDVKSDPIAKITPKGVQLASGEEYEVDVLIFATGFDAITGPLLRMGIVGRGGLTLKEKWEGGPRTYLGLSTVGFPNMFMITGPGSPSVLGNMMTSIEQHVEWVADALKYLEEHGVETIEALPEAEDTWVDHVNEVANMTLFPRANSWYVGANIPGKPRVFMPYVGGFGNYRLLCDDVVAKGYEGFVLK